MNNQRILFTITLFIAATIGLSAESDWPQFRGLHGGVAEDYPSLPDHWEPDENIVWSLAVPGRAWSSPIVSDNHVFVMSVVNTSGVETPLKP